MEAHDLDPHRPDVPMMTCGHAANATCSQAGGKTFEPPIPSCAICSCLTVAAVAPDLAGRTAKCSYNNPSGSCKSEVPSSPSLAFFEHRPTDPTDRYYCGCWGVGLMVLLDFLILVGVVGGLRSVVRTWREDRPRAPKARPVSEARWHELWVVDRD